MLLDKLESELQAHVPELPPSKFRDVDFFLTNIVDDMYEFLRNMVNQTKSSSGLNLNNYEAL